MDVFERDVQDLIPLPVPKVEMPPLARVHDEPFGLQHAAQQGAVPALARRAARIIREGTRRRFVVGRRHLDRHAGRQVVEREIHRRAAVVLRTVRRVRHEPVGLGGRRVPEHLRHIPRPVGVVDQDPVAEGPQHPRRPHERQGGRPLQEGAGRGVDDRAEEVVRRCVPDIESDRGIQPGGLHQVGRQKRGALSGRRQPAIDPEQLRDRSDGLQAKLPSRRRPHLEAPQNDRPHLDFARPKDDAVGVVGSATGEREHRLRRLRETTGRGGPEERHERAALFIDVERVVARRVRADQAQPGAGRCRRLRRERVGGGGGGGDLQQQREDDHFSGPRRT